MTATLSPYLSGLLQVTVPEFMIDPDAAPPACSTVPGDWHTDDPTIARGLAQKTCRVCPHLVACRTHGLARESSGIWGGVLIHRTRRTNRRYDLLEAK